VPGFHHSVAVSPFVVPLCRAVVPLPFFRSVATVAVAGENRNAGNVFPYTSSDQNADWLSTNGRTAKNRIGSYCYGTAITAQRQVETATAQRIFFHVSKAILTAITEFTER